MADNKSFTHTIRSYGGKMKKVHLHDWIILLLLAGIGIGLNAIEHFHRFVGEDMMTDLKFPYKKHDTIPFWGVPIVAVLLPILIFAIIYFKRRNVYDLHHAILDVEGWYLSEKNSDTNLFETTQMRLADHGQFYRCFPEGIVAFDPTKNGDVLCNGDPTVIKEGYKSFPSGHSSWSFAGLGFLAWYLAGNLQVFDRNGHVAKLCPVFLPLLVATLIAISRVDDYWHHWQDVLTGGFLGLVVASFSYLQFFPPPYDAQATKTIHFPSVHEATTK